MPEDYHAEGTVTAIVLGTVGGGVFPWLFHGILGLPGTYISALPQTILTGFVFGGMLFVLTASSLQGRVLDLKLTAHDHWLKMAGFHIEYGLILGLWVGLARSLWYPLFGI